MKAVGQGGGDSKLKIGGGEGDFCGGGRGKGSSVGGGLGGGEIWGGEGGLAVGSGGVK